LPSKELLFTQFEETFKSFDTSAQGKSKAKRKKFLQKAKKASFHVHSYSYMSLLKKKFGITQ